MTAAFHFMAMYGLRVGDLLTVRIEDTERFSYRQKGGEVLQRRLKPETAELLKRCGMCRRSPFSGIAKITVQKAMRRVATALAAGGKIRHAYSAHDFRYANLLSFLTFSPKVLSTRYLARKRLA